VQTRRLVASFEPLNSCLPLSMPELRAHKAMCDPVVLARKSLKRTGRQRVNTCHELFSSSHWGWKKCWKKAQGTKSCFKLLLFSLKCSQMFYGKRPLIPWNMFFKVNEAAHRLTWQVIFNAIVYQGDNHQLYWQKFMHFPWDGHHTAVIGRNRFVNLTMTKWI